jgi:hypothetical protein
VTLGRGLASFLSLFELFVSFGPLSMRIESK